jgi:hypothetical protein
MRKCEQCGTVDKSSAWASADAAAKDGAFDGTWSCSSCAWTEFDLAETSGDSSEAPELAKPR